MNHRFRGSILTSVLTAACLCVTWITGWHSHASGQVTATGTISGTVMDVTGAVVPGADVNIIDLQTHLQTHTKSSSAGEFSVPGLAPGNYDVAVSATGLAPYRQTGIYLEPAADFTVSARLKAAGATSEVTVEANAAQVQTETPEVSNEVYEKQVEGLPLNGRNYQGLAALMPGVTNINAGTGLTSGGYITQNSLNVNGTGQTGTLYTVDGIWNMNTSNMQETTIMPNPDQIQEVKVLQNNYSAVNNIMGANAVIVLTKSGTSTFHGTGWEFYRNTNFDARNYFSTTVPKEDQNLYGFDLGGPVFVPRLYNTDKNKTFFYVNLQWVQLAQAMVFNGTTPTAAMRGISTPNGDALFPSTGLYSTANLKDPTTGKSFSKDANGNWVIPAARLDKSALAFLNALAPLPNNQTTATTNYLNDSPANDNQLDQEYKIEHNINPKYRLLAEFLHEGQSYAYPRGQRLGSAYPTNHDVFNTHNSLAQVALTQILSPTMTNQTSFAMNRYIFYHDIVGIAHVSDIPGYTQNLAYTGGYLQNYLPTVTFSGGWSSMGTGSAYILPRFAELELILSDNWSWQHGRHFLQAGGNILWGTHREYSNSGPSTTGTFNFNGQTTGNSIADFDLGYAATYSQSSTQVRKYIHYPLDTFYAQDQWHASSRFTLTAGLRFFYMPEPHEQVGYEVSFDPAKFNPANAPVVSTGGVLTPTSSYDPANGLTYNGKNGIPTNLSDAHKYYFSPVVGFAYDPVGDGKTSFRGGYSINYTKSAANSDCAVSCITAPVIQNVSLINVNFPDPIGGAAAPTSAPVIYGEDRPNMRAATIQTFSAGVQHEFPHNWVISIAGAGDRDTHLPQMLNLNQPGPVAGYDFNPLLNTGKYSNAYFAQYQGYSNINWYTSDAFANWDAFEASVRHPVGHGLFVSGAYTWSHNLTMLSGQQFGIEGSTPQNSSNPYDDYGNSTLDLPNVFGGSIVYQAPWFQHAAPVKRALLAGWRFSDMTTIQSGNAITPGLSTSGNGLATRPDVIAPISYPKTLKQWFTTTSFKQPPAGFFGNASPGILRGPGLVVFDATIGKDTHIGERVNVVWRMEFFNLFNHTNFGNPGASLGANTFGAISSAKDPRMGEMVFKVVF
ncbi:MAG TPA: carboxypeptidase regulatory-like domain-containing protein [Acidobacteriaceae bacterium]|nr:carboxypeptidase regulatory-like domain-containing protein [Acidobacteriaceae bacterium]